jgi:hypothetical protein
LAVAGKLAANKFMSVEGAVVGDQMKERLLKLWSIIRCMSQYE